MKRIFLMAFAIAGTPMNSAVAQGNFMSVSDLVFACDYRANDEYARSYNLNRCQNYLGGAIDTLRVYYAGKEVKCLPVRFSINILKADVLETAKYVEKPDAMTAATLIGQTMTAKYKCPALLTPAF